MGIFGFLGKKKTSPAQKAILKEAMKDIRIIEDTDKAIADMQKADALFEKDGDIEKRIKVYEKYLLKEPQWNSTNFNLSLARMYIKARHNDKAWGYLNQLYLWAVDPKVIGGDAPKVRFEQFRILKAEKRYKDALIMLVSSYVINAYLVRDMYFNKAKFVKEAKTTAKAIGFSEDQLEAFADELERRIKAKKIKEDSVKKYCSDYYLKLKL